MNPEEGTTRKLGRKSGKFRPGRGRQARWPWEIPPAGWVDCLWRTWVSVKGDRIGFVAAGLAFYLLLSLVPTLVSILAIYGMVADVGTIYEQINELRGVVPSGVIDFMRSEVSRISDASNTSATGLAISICLALWGASRAHTAIATGLDVAYGEKTSRGFLAARLRALAFALLTTLVAVVILILLVLGPVVAQVFKWEWADALAILRWPFLGLVFWGWVIVTFRYGPSRRAPRWQWVTIGSFVATVLWLTSSWVLGKAAGQVLDLGKTYGSLAGVVLLLLWFHSFGFCLLLGAELDSEIEHQTARDTTIGPEKPLGSRNAHVADTIGRAKSDKDKWFGET